MVGKSRFLAAVAVCLCLTAATPLFAQQPNSEPLEKSWSVGVSAISPALPVAVKAILARGQWALQFEANYFYLWAVARVDGRRTIRSFKRTDVYAFAGLTGLYFAEDNDLRNTAEKTLAADVGIGGELYLGKHRRLGIGMEGGLLIPFLSSISLDQYDNSGIMVANIYVVYRL
ncbi:MAG: hypothetical protein ACQEQU_01650 [Spirochaetota bacterium]